MKLSTLFATVATATLLASGAFAQDTLTGTNTANSGSNSTSGASAGAIGGLQNTNVTTTSASGAISGSVSGSRSEGNTTTTNQSQNVNQNQAQTTNQGQTNTQGQTNGQTNSQASTSSNSNTFNSAPIPSHTTATVYAPPQIVAPALSTTLTETCMGSASGGLSLPWGGITGGKTYEDHQCVRRLNSRELAAQGFRTEACYVMMGDPEVAEAFRRSGRSCELATAHPETSYPNIAPPPPPPPPPQEAPVPPAEPQGMSPIPNPPAERDIVQPDGERGVLPPGTMAPIPNPPESH